MRKRFLVFSILFSLIAGVAFSQSQDAALKGTVKDEKGEPAAVIIEIFLNGVLKGGKPSDILDGTYRFDGLTPGLYEIRFTGVAGTNYSQVVIKDYQLRGDATATLDQVMSAPTVTTKTIVITGKKSNFDKNVTGNFVGERDIKNSPTRGVINYITAQTPGTTNSASGLSIKGNRGYGTVYYIDGVKAIGSGAISLPQSAVGEIAVLSGGIPAEYGDATGGFVNITTKGPSGKFTGGIDILSSQFLDNYGYNSIEGSLSGPLITKNIMIAGSDKPIKQPILGFIVSGGYTRTLDGSPGYTPQYKVKDNYLEDLKNNPLRPSIDQPGIYVPNANYITMNEIEVSPYRLNSASSNLNITGKLDFRPTDNIAIIAGGSYNMSDGSAYIRQYSLFNFANNPQVKSENSRAYVRFRHNLKLDTAIFNSAYYSVQFDYTKVSSVTQDRDFGDNYLNYGYIGKFDVYRRPFYLTQDITVDVNGERRKLKNAKVLIGRFSDSVGFTRGGVNTVSENYTQRYYDLVSQRGDRVNSINEIRSTGGLVNGDQPALIYSLWNNIGTKYGSFGKSETEQYSANFSSSLNLKKKHNIKFGVTYEQQISRGYSLSTSSMWSFMRQLSNRHLTQFDTAHPILVYDGQGNFTDTVNYLYQNGGNQSNFDKNIRTYLVDKNATDEFGNKIDAQSQLNTDRYSPDDYKKMAQYLYDKKQIKENSVMALFSPDELLNSGNSYVNYYGYDYTGNRLSKRYTRNDFLQDSNNRYINPYAPIYVAGYIQDKFEFKDITFNVGLRIDRFDANQSVLKDAYSVYPTRTVKEIIGKSFGSNSPYSKPGTIGDDYVPYMNDPINPTANPIAYRNPVTNKWYNANGVEVTDVTSLADLTGGQLLPYLAGKPSKTDAKRPINESFKDYQPEITFMPRISFAFPISERADIYANYNVLTQRPKTGNFATIDDYYFLIQRATGTINNPALRPERTTAYEIGLRQSLDEAKLNNISVQAYYSEIRDLIQVVRLYQAYPISYSSFGNIDFGTVKGAFIEYTMDKPNTSGISLTAKYALQFATGTGSEASSAAGLIEAGQPNLRIPLPLNYDVRHKMSATIDYRFGRGQDYVGSTDTTLRAMITRMILEDAGAYILLTAASGTPYTRQSNVTQDVSIGIAQRRGLLGDPNGARLPWNYRMDATIDKNFMLGGRVKKVGEVTSISRMYFMNVYLTIQNVLNTQNVGSVYRYTGNANDDGFLTSAEGQKTINNLSEQTARQAYYDQYKIKVQNPDNYGAPRIIRLGLRMNF